MVRYAILGPVTLCDGERRVAVGGPRQVALLALLLGNANRALSSDWLIDTLWGDRRADTAVKRLQMAIVRLRRTLDPEAAQAESMLRTVAGGYLLAVRPGELDAEVFEERVQDGRRALQSGNAAHGREMLSEALGLWRGPVLAEVAYEEFAQPQIRRLEELRLAALETRADCELRLGGHGEVVSELEGLLAAHPGRERLAAQLMLAMYRCGRQADALEVYARTRAYLVGELGLAPGPALQTLQDQILAQSPALQPDVGESGSAASLDAPAQQVRVLPTGVVTFLLTDIEGSTGLWEADADAMAASLELLEGVIARAVGSNGGQLLKRQGEGDATLSIFQSACDAVVCAAELQHAVGTASWPSRLQLRVRIALHSGEAQERSGDYFGPVLNRVARLRSLAAGGVIVVSQSTAALARDHLPRELALVDVGRHELRGLSRPERVFELRVMKDAATGGFGDVGGPIVLELPRAVYAPAALPFVGRDTEFELLRERWTHACGRAQAVVIGGEPGIGKTRLASELARVVHGEGALVLYGRCDEGLSVPYQPFVEALQAYARAVGLDRLRAELGDLAAELGRLLPELAPLGVPSRGDPESERFALFDAVAALLEIATREQRALLVLEDLHWAATPTLLLLRHLLRSERPLGALVICTYRETELEPGQPLAQLLADLHRDTTAERLSIRGLDQQAIAALLEAAVGHLLDDRASELARVLGAHTAGNPFFIRELLAHLAESGMMPGAGEHAPPGLTAARLQAPEGLRHVITHRVARLSAAARRTLRLAAVAGQTFSFALLERMVDERADILDGLDETVAAGLLTEAGNGDYAFAHALVRQTIYRQLGAARRMRLHRQLGEALEAIGEVATHVEALAHHFAEAAADGQADKAAVYALAAGRTAAARLGYEEAAAHYERGLKCLALTGQASDARRCELLLALGDARWAAGSIDTARQACLQAAELANELGDTTALAQATLSFCGPYRYEEAADATGAVAALLLRALGALSEDDSSLRARLLGRLAALPSAQEQRPVLAREALEMARRVADKATLADVLASSQWAARGPDSVHDSVAVAKEFGRVADEVGDRLLRARAHGWLICHLLELGDIDAVEREFEALQQLTDPLRERFFQWYRTTVRANHAHLRGRLDECETLARDAFAHRFEGQDETATQTFGIQMFFVRREQGRLDELVENVQRNIARYPQVAGWRCALAYIYAQLERGVQARQELDSLARDDFADLPRDTFWLSSLSVLCEVVSFVGDLRRAQLLYDLLLPYADRCAVTIALLCEGSVSRPLGLLATTLSRYEDAARHYEHALKMNDHIRSPVCISRTQHDYARMLLLRNHRGDNDKALQLLTETLNTTEELGLTAIADRARPLKLAATAAASSPALAKPA